MEKQGEHSCTPLKWRKPDKFFMHRNTSEGKAENEKTDVNRPNCTLSPGAMPLKCGEERKGAVRLAC